jgi:hypothetical protein
MRKIFKSGQHSSGILPVIRIGRGGCKIAVISIILIMGPGWFKSVGGKERREDLIWFDDLVESRFASADSNGERNLRLNSPALSRLLEQVPSEETWSSVQSQFESPVELPLPIPDGRTIRFRIVSSPVMEPGLAAKYPEIRTYSGQSIDDPGVTMRCDLTPQGFHATVLMPGHSIIIHPDSRFQEGEASGSVNGDILPDGTDRYVSYFGKRTRDIIPAVLCDVRDDGSIERQNASGLREAAAGVTSTGDSLRIFRIALAASWEYAERYGGGTNAGTIASMVTWLNGANLVFEREVAVRLQLIDAPSLIYSTERGFNSQNDPFQPGNNARNLDSLAVVMATIGNERFDLGHLLDWGAGGSAFVGVACQNSLKSGGPIKGLAVSGLNTDLGEAGNLSIFVHELGHQFGATHTFNGTVGNCGAAGQRERTTAYESGSGSTVMSYAGLCDSNGDSDNIIGFASGSLRFHFGSIAQITSYIGGSGACFNPLVTSNNVPWIDGGPDYVIPRRTPFELRAVGNDPNPEDRSNLTYVWDQIDAGMDFSNPPYSDSGDPPTATRPIFRPAVPVKSPSRIFPSLNYILSYANVAPDVIGGYRTAESLPAIGRTLNFGVTLRDNRSGGGGVSRDTVIVTVADNAGPFIVTVPNGGESWNGGLRETVSWLVGNTNSSPVNCQQVRISLSLDGGATFPIVLEESTANDGREEVLIPRSISTSQARIKIEAVGNIFFDIGDAGFTINGNGLTAPVRESKNSGGPRPSRGK